jgi:hypothetical protein
MPDFTSQESGVQSLPSLQFFTAPTQAPALQVSAVVQALASSQATVLAVCTQPLPAVQLAQAIVLLSEGPDRGTPHIDPGRQPCLLSDGLPCTHVCPSAALLPVARASDVRLGTARIEPALCTACRST